MTWILIHSRRHACIHWGVSVGKPCSDCWEWFKNKLNLISFSHIPYGLEKDNIYSVQSQSGDDKYQSVAEKKKISLRNKYYVLDIYLRESLLQDWLGKEGDWIRKIFLEKVSFCPASWMMSRSCIQLFQLNDSNHL